jgi:xanthine dehydrogenase YagT iron-sulfur-binding subunit
VQQAFVAHDGTMCGFCTPGFVMSAVALLEKHPSPTPEQARQALDGNICRCGTYTRVLEAVLDPQKGAARG